jgi:hypothetical protein
MPDCQQMDPSLQQKDGPSYGGWGWIVTIATRPRDARTNNRSSILNRTKKFISSQSNQTGSGAYAVSYSICVGLVHRGVEQWRIFKWLQQYLLPSISLNDVQSDNFTSRCVCWQYTTSLYKFLVPSNTASSSWFYFAFISVLSTNLLQ